MEEAINWLHYGAVAINAILIPLGVKLLRPLWAQAPQWLKTFIPVVAGSLIVMAETYLFNVFGEPIDLSELLNMLTQSAALGAALGVGASAAYKVGKGR